MKFVFFLKSRQLFGIFYCFYMFVNKHFIPYRGFFSGKWLKFLQVTKFFPDFLFPTIIFPYYFSPGKEFIPIFFPISCLSKAVLTKISKWEWKQRIEKNYNNTDINTTRNCTFVNFKNYKTLKTSKRIGLVTPTVQSSVLSLKNPKLREQLFSGKKQSQSWKSF